ncbi:outer membrane beta-barrel protein [Algoriphagus mannitolivorans]|uniref:outer membrane beta-barrel protein n=1 Tax=Algoriphagus mannitolivorans TaxID=226504 RepID=UPI000408F1B7|nr:outer membrane beta-barrel protein [Algoriphagus mannitolivorans]
MKTDFSVSFNFRKLIPLQLIFLGLISFSSFAQRPEKKDYIVIQDSVLTQGKVFGIPSENNTLIFFAQSKKEDPQPYRVNEITEFRVSERMFFKKEISLPGMPAVVFLEKLPHSNEKAVFWKWNGRPNIFFLESSGKMQRLGDDYAQVIKEGFSNPLLDPLLDLTSLSEISLVYFSRTSNTIQKPRTFSKLVGITPYLGYSQQTVEFEILDTNLMGQVSGSSPAVGLNFEVFPTFQRNLSLNLGGFWSQFDSQSFFNYQSGGNPVESDIFLDFQTIQFPLTGRYYFDLKPNKLRLYGELGFSFALMNYEKLGVYQAQRSGQNWVTAVKSFEMEQNFTGSTWGLGAEKNLTKGRAIVFGLRGFKVSGKRGEGLQGLTFSTGFKF